MSSMIGFLKKIHDAILRAKHGLYITKYLGVRQLIAVAAAKSTPNGFQSHEALCVCSVSILIFSFCSRCENYNSACVIGPVVKLSVFSDVRGHR